VPFVLSGVFTQRSADISKARAPWKDLRFAVEGTAENIEGNIHKHARAAAQLFSIPVSIPHPISLPFRSHFTSQTIIFSANRRRSCGHKLRAI